MSCLLPRTAGVLLLVALSACAKTPVRPSAALPASSEDAACLVDTATRPVRSTRAPVWIDVQHGLASWYGRTLQGRRTASGERFNMHELTAAHRTLPFGTHVMVRNPRNQREVVVRINDRGPHQPDRVIDLSRAAASALGLLGRGEASVDLLLPMTEGGPAPRPLLGAC